MRDVSAGLTYTEMYTEVKEVLWKGFNVTKEGSRKIKFNTKMTPKEYVVQAMKLTPDKREEQM